MTRFTHSLLLLTLTALCSSPSFANKEEDATWISACISDNKREGQAVETVMIYCKCMNDQMSETETRSITEWEKSHPKEEALCSKQAGWK